MLVVAACLSWSLQNLVFGGLVTGHGRLAESGRIGCGTSADAEGGACPSHDETAHCLGSLKGTSKFHRTPRANLSSASGEII